MGWVPFPVSVASDTLHCPQTDIEGSSWAEKGSVRHAMKFFGCKPGHHTMNEFTVRLKQCVKECQNEMQNSRYRNLTEASSWQKFDDRGERVSFFLRVLFYKIPFLSWFGVNACVPCPALGPREGEGVISESNESRRGKGPQLYIQLG